MAKPLKHELQSQSLWRFYFTLVKEIPGAFRTALEAVVFWLGGGVSVLTLLSPTIWGLLPQREVPRWVSLTVLGAVFVYGLLRANYNRFEALRTQGQSSADERDALQAELQSKSLQQLVPDFELALGESMSTYKPDVDITIVVLAVALINRGSASAAVAWGGHFKSETRETQDGAKNLLNSIAVPLPHGHQLILTQADLIQSKTMSPIAQGQVVHGRIVLEFPGNIMPDIDAGKALITVSCQDYTHRAYSAIFQGGAPARKTADLFFSTERVVAPATPPAPRTAEPPSQESAP